MVAVNVRDKHYDKDYVSYEVWILGVNDIRVVHALISSNASSMYRVNFFLSFEKLKKKIQCY